VVNNQSTWIHHWSYFDFHQSSRDTSPNYVKNCGISCRVRLNIPFSSYYLQVGGPYWEVPLGRKDSITASYALATTNLPNANEGLLSIISKFLYQGLSVTDMVALSGTPIYIRRLLIYRNFEQSLHRLCLLCAFLLI
jgi:hypothetical protein